MLMLEGQGIYRLGEAKWYHVRAGDAIYMVRPRDPRKHIDSEADQMLL